MSRKGVPARARASRRARDARVVWPPAERTESAADAMRRVMREHGLSQEFPVEVERQARAAARRAWQRAGERADLRDLATFTVDPHTARDFDDAISARRLPDGAVRVWVHIADVAAHVGEGSALDDEARERSTSVYVPGAVAPMLPHALSSDACSLGPGAERLAVTVELDLHGAAVRSARFYRSLIRSDERLDYEQVDRVFAGREPAPAPWGESLQAARAAAAALEDARRRRGALVVDSEEPEFEFDRHGEVRTIHQRVHTESHRLIEHLMIAANEAVAAHLAERGVPCLYRVHERPDPGRIAGLIDQLHSLDVPTPPVPDPLGPEQAAELVGQISRLVDAHIRRTGTGRIALGSLVLRSLKQAYYAPHNLGHTGLRSPCYCHFTSPIRRYPDIVCHRALLSTLGAAERPPNRGRLAGLGEWASERERLAAAVERQADDVAACFHLERLLLDRGWEQPFRGEVTGLIPAGAFVAFGLSGDGGPPQIVYEGMLPVRLMPAGAERDWWELNEHGTIMKGQRSGVTLRLGQPLEVHVLRVDTVRGRVDLAPAAGAAGAGGG
jgi:ribonuclease R